jgi:hypothetical protein
LGNLALSTSGEVGPPPEVATNEKKKFHLVDNDALFFFVAPCLAFGNPETMSGRGHQLDALRYR